LLVSQVSICGDEYFKAGGLGRVEDVAIPEAVPAARASFLDNMVDEGTRDCVPLSKRTRISGW
jgi:hypothetical protein